MGVSRAAAELGGVRQLVEYVRHQIAAVAVGVHEIICSHRHAGTRNLRRRKLRLEPGVRRSDGARERRETAAPIAELCEWKPVIHTEAAQGLVHVALDLAPKCAIIAEVGAVDIWIHGDARTKPVPHIFVIFDAGAGQLSAGRPDSGTDRIVTVRA